MCGCFLHAPYWGLGLQPRHVPWLGIKPVTLWFTAYAQSTELHQPGLNVSIFKYTQSGELFHALFLPRQRTGQVKYSKYHSLYKQRLQTHSRRHTMPRWPLFYPNEIRRGGRACFKMGGKEIYRPQAGTQVWRQRLWLPRVHWRTAGSVIAA